MRVTISFKNLEHTEALDTKIREKTAKLKKFFEGNTNVYWTCQVKEGQHHSEVKLTGPTFEYHANAKSENLYKTFDTALAKIERQLSKKKEKWKNRINKKNLENANIEILDPEMAWAEHDEDAYDDVA